MTDDKATEDSERPYAVVAPVERPVRHQRRTFDVLYYSRRDGKPKEFSHKYREDWDESDLFCPRCGSQSVWVNDGGGDYYVGVQHVCTACRGVFYLPGGVTSASDDSDVQRLAALMPNVELTGLRPQGATSDN